MKPGGRCAIGARACQRGRQQVERSAGPARRTAAGIHPQPYSAWMEQLARHLTDPVEGCLRTASHLIHDRDPLYTRVFGEILTGGGVQPIRLPPKSPNLNAYAE